MMPASENPKMRRIRDRFQEFMKKANPPNNRGCQRAILGFPLLGLVLTVLWLVYESVSFKTLEGGSDPEVVQKSIGYTLIPFCAGIIAGLTTLLFSKTMGNDQ